MTENKKQSSWQHSPVMLKECFEQLKPALESGGCFFDMTLGLGGHSKYFLENFPSIKVVGFDRDESAISIAKERLVDFENRTVFIHAKYDEFEKATDDLKLKPRAILFDLGVSSMQLDDESRGFTYLKNVELDMRMGKNDKTAFELIAELSVEELSELLREFSQERYALAIAKSIKKGFELKLSENEKFKTGDLATAVRIGLPKGTKDEQVLSSIKRVFQSLRIAVNDELNIFENALRKAISSLEVGGRIVVLSYQSLEDQITKRVFNEFANVSSKESALRLPFQPEEEPAILKLLTKGAQKASDEEISQNMRAKPVRMRAVQKMMAVI